MGNSLFKILKCNQIVWKNFETTYSFSNSNCTILDGICYEIGSATLPGYILIPNDYVLIFVIFVYELIIYLMIENLLI